MKRSPQHTDCQLCGRQVGLTFHHLIPKKLHRRQRFKKTYSRETLASGIWICRQCHTGIHRLYDEMTLGKHLNSRDSLLADAAVQRHIQWVRRQKQSTKK